MRECFLSGRLGKEPEIVSPNGSERSVIKFSIANGDESRKGQDGQYSNVTSWFDIEFWTKNPQTWLQKLYKGTEVSMHCNAKQDTWKTEDGSNRSRIKFVVSRGSFPLVGAGKSEQKQQEPAQPQAPVPQDDMDIPF